MRLISWAWFLYVLVGFIMGGGAVMIYNTLKKASLKLVWYEWILTVLSFIVFTFLCQTFIASFQEHEPKAAWFTLIFLGLPILIMGVIVYRSLNKRRTKNLES